MTEINERLNAIVDKLEEASDEIIAEIEKLKNESGLSEEAKSTLARLEEKAEALADLVPQDEPPPAP